MHKLDGLGWVGIGCFQQSTSSQLLSQKCEWFVSDMDSVGDLNKSLNLIPYSPVTPHHCKRKRPVLFAPNTLAKTIVQKFLNLGGAMEFTMCKPGTNRKDVEIGLSIYNAGNRANTNRIQRGQSKTIASVVKCRPLPCFNH